MRKCAMSLVHFINGPAGSIGAGWDKSQSKFLPIPATYWLTRIGMRT